MEDLWFASNDIPIDVLSRLPLKTLLNIKCVSKQWHRLISERSFIRQQSERKEPISGFFFQERFQWCDDDIRSISYIPVNTEEATKVRRSIFDFLPQSIVLLSVSNGLICCRSCFPSPQPEVYICNPLNKEWVTLPWPTVPKQSSLGLAFDPSRDTTDESTNFKVVAVHQNETETEMEDLYFSYDVYSSKTKTWTRSKEICQCNHIKTSVLTSSLPFPAISDDTQSPTNLAGAPSDSGDHRRPSPDVLSPPATSIVTPVTVFIEEECTELSICPVHVLFALYLLSF
ncbi:hypothetical protein RHGRI_008630 [Rhododendron griersonianum]|uniref:F-box domain-containing protein n=1 Tax=Rhododendron griersonianum TaxID=479676 RepID=A0AAV6L459_9ERIC|nr:hypothetical protein RHGRI_008630 [Rhododendron griersonianum]